MTFDSSGHRVYGNDVNKCVLINEAGVRIQRDDANRVEVNSGSINLVVGNKNSIISGIDPYDNSNGLHLFGSSIRLFGGSLKFYNTNRLSCGEIKIGSSSSSQNDNNDKAGYSSFSNGIVIDVPGGDAGGFAVDGHDANPFIYYKTKPGYLRLDRIERIGLYDGTRGISVVCKIRANNSHYWLWFKRGVLVHARNESSEPTGFTPLIKSAFNTFVYDWS